MRWIVIVVAVLFAVELSPGSADAQRPAGFGSGEIEVVVEETAKESGDGSGEYSLATVVKDDEHDIEITHTLVKTRTVLQEIVREEAMRVEEDGDEIATAESDPAELGSWTGVAVDYVIPFAVDWDPEKRENYRPLEDDVRKAVHSVAPDAGVRTSTRRSDGRTTATISFEEAMPVDALARQVVEIRDQLEQADIAMARVRFVAKATPPEGDTDVLGSDTGSR